MARTGSGKTAAFLLPMFEKLKTHSAKTGAIYGLWWELTDQGWNSRNDGHLYFDPTCDRSLDLPHWKHAR
jgi:hypothetical protein